MSWDARRECGIPDKGSRKGVYVGTPEPAFDPLCSGQAPLCGSKGVSIRRDTRPAEAGHVGSCRSDPVSIQGYGGYPEGEEVGS